MISDGIMPSNEGQRLCAAPSDPPCGTSRKNAWHRRTVPGETCSETVINESKDGYPELEEKKEFIFKVLTQEEEKFNKTIDQGLAILADDGGEMKKDGKKVLSGEDAFKLYDTYGFPVDLTEEILEEKGFSI